jgi:hypothetical protein
MIRISVLVTAGIIAGMHASCYAGVNCDDWIDKGGYCVDYVKTKIPTFPTPQTATELAALNNKDITDVTEGDVAIFRYSNYWHVAYVEKVHFDKHGNATVIDVSEMNFGRQLSLYEYQKIWRVRSNSEWKRAISCGVTYNYNKKRSRKKVALNTVKQIWSPGSDTVKVARRRRVDIVADRVRGILSRFFLRLQSKENS